jgi:RimJ/RimL family protein N-acetyltransferase
MQIQPAFETDRLSLTPRSLSETEDCLAMDRAPGVTDHVSGPWVDPAAHRAFTEARTGGPYPPGLGYWTIRSRAAPTRFSGWVLLIPEDAVGPAIEIGWRLHPDVWGLGYATEAARPILAHAFATLGLAEVVAGIMPGNEGSIRVATKLGFHVTGEVVGPYRRYRMRREDFTAGWSV